MVLRCVCCVVHGSNLAPDNTACPHCSSPVILRTNASALPVLHILIPSASLVSDLETCSKILKGIRGGKLTVVRISKSGTPQYFRSLLSGRQKFSSDTQHESCTSMTATIARSCTVQTWSCSVLFPQQWHSCAHIWKCDPLQQAAAVGCHCDTGRHHHSRNKTRLTVMCGCPVGKKNGWVETRWRGSPAESHVALRFDGSYLLVSNLCCAKAFLIYSRITDKQPAFWHQ